MKQAAKRFSWRQLALALALTIIANIFPKQSAAQDYDDPPGRVARLGYMQGSVSFRPAGEDDWVGAVPNRPMTTGDQVWTDQNSRAEIQLGSAVIRLAPNTGFSFLNLDDKSIQMQLTSGAISATVRRLDGGDDFEVDTPNQAFTALQPGHYRFDASEDGNYTVISVREGMGEATGGGQTFTLRAGQAGTFSGTDQLYADVEPLEQPDDFEVWCAGRDHRYEISRSAHYLSHDVVGYEDLDDYGDWRDDSNYGHVWFPNQVEAGWAPYHTGHWAWISPWGWTWVDDSSWGYAPFHYGRWVSLGGRWGWVAGPPAVHAVYAPALVVFIGGGPGAFGGNVGWFPLGPREVFVPSYHVTPAYVNRVNVSNTTVNVTQVTNVYNTTIINKTRTITNVTYVNRSVQGAVTAVPRTAFVSAQPVNRAAVRMNSQAIASAPLSARVPVAPTNVSVLGAHAATAGRVAAPPAAVANRQVVAKRTPPPAPVPFAKQQQALEAHPGQPLARNEVQKLQPAAATGSRAMVRTAPPAKAATPNVGHPASLPGRAGTTGPAGRPTPEPNRPPAPDSRHQTTPANSRPSANTPLNRSEPSTPTPNVNRPSPEPNRPPVAQPKPSQENRATPPPARNDHPPSAQPNNRPAPDRPSPEPNRPPVAQPKPPQENRATPPPARNDRPPSAQPNNRPAPNRPSPEPNRPPVAQPKPPQENHPTAPPARNDRPPSAQPNNRPAPNDNKAPSSAMPPRAQHTPPASAKPTTGPKKQPSKPQRPEDKEQREEQKKPPNE
jgi:FecR protein